MTTVFTLQKAIVAYSFTQFSSEWKQDNMLLVFMDVHRNLESKNLENYDMSEIDFKWTGQVFRMSGVNIQSIVIIPQVLG